MLGWLKRKRKDYDDMEDIRSNVLGSDLMRSAPEPDFPLERPPKAVGFDEPRFQEPPGFSTINTRFSEYPEIKQKDRDYDILDRLNLIESQLAAIRSQTETINERLKNLETKLTRRY